MSRRLDADVFVAAAPQSGIAAICGFYTDIFIRRVDAAFFFHCTISGSLRLLYLS